MATPFPKPGQPPSANLLNLLKAVNELRALAALTPLPPEVMNLPAWKQWVEGTGPYDVKGLRDILNTYGIVLDGMKTNIDAQAQSIIELRSAVQALQEAPAARPFP